MWANEKKVYWSHLTSFQWCCHHAVGNRNRNRMHCSAMTSCKLGVCWGSVMQLQQSLSKLKSIAYEIYGIFIGVLVYRCPDTSLQPIFGSLWNGSGPGRAFGILVNAQPGVSGLLWPCLRLPLRSPCLRGLQGERQSRARNVVSAQWRWFMYWTEVLRNALSGLLLTSWKVTLFPLFVCIFVNTHQLHPLQVTTQVETS